MWEIWFNLINLICCLKITLVRQQDTMACSNTSLWLNLKLKMHYITFCVASFFVLCCSTVVRLVCGNKSQSAAEKAEQRFIVHAHLNKVETKPSLCSLICSLSARHLSARRKPLPRWLSRVEIPPVNIRLVSFLNCAFSSYWCFLPPIMH